MSDYYVVCGSRKWPEDELWFVTAQMIHLIPRRAVVISGGAPGVDRHADKEAVRLGYERLLMLADWKSEPRDAGRIRNIRMLDMHPKAVLAFQWKGSGGTGHTIREARKRGIELHHFTEVSVRPDLSLLDTDFEPITPDQRTYPRVADWADKLHDDRRLT